MRRSYGLLMVLVLLVAACGGSPKAKAREFAERLPEQIGEFRQEDNRVELTAEAIGSTGHVTVLYTQRNVAEVYIVIDTFGTKSAADVALARRQRDLRLMGYEFDINRRGSPTAQIADLSQGRIAIFQRDDMLIEIQYIKLGDEVDEDSWEFFINTIRAVDESL